jgi:hypothetical protein
MMKQTRKDTQRTAGSAANSAKRGMNKTLAVVALLITIFLLATIVLISGSLEQRRQNSLDGEMQGLYNSLNEMQIYMLMSDTYDSKMACIAYQEKLRDLDKTVWELGRKIEQYRVTSEQFRKDPYYTRQKQLFNENEMLYLMLTRKVQQECGEGQTAVLFFYKNADECKKCDDQSFILSDINREIDPEIAVFSFDTDLNLTTVGLLTRYYDIKEYPCVIVDDMPYCGIQDKRFIIDRLCRQTPEISICAMRE